MSEAAPAVRVAHAGDAEPLAALAERTFRATFAPHNRDENVALHCAYPTSVPARSATTVVRPGSAISAAWIAAP